MKKSFFVFFVVIFIISCKNTTKNIIENTDENQVKTDQNIEENNNIINHEKEYLTIIGNQIWVRSEPTSGDVVMKLDDGTKCLLIEKGEQKTIKGITDFWYKIEYEGEIGWVFGSQTSLIQNVSKKNDQVDEVEVFLSEFLQTIKNKEFENLHSFFVDDSFLELYNPGVFIYVVKEPYKESKLFAEFGIKGFVF